MKIQSILAAWQQRGKTAQQPYCFVPGGMCNASNREHMSDNGFRILASCGGLVTKLIVALLGFSLIEAVASAATVAAASASRADVTAAISAASDGDTVQIPAGTATWSSEVSVAKPITIMGAGTNATIVTGQPHCFSVSLPSGKIAQLIRISNMRLNGSYDPTANGDYIIYAAGNVAALRVDHIWFRGGFMAVEAGDIGSWAYGVIDHCTFQDPCIAVRPQGGNLKGWAAPQVPGTTNCICIEDNLFVFTSNANHSLYTGSWPQEMIYHQWGARSCIRNNTFDASALTSTSNGADATWCDIIDAHGNQGYGTGSNVEESTVIVECYSNIFKCDRTGIFANLRGGCQIWYSNRFINVSTSSGAEYMRLSEEETWQTSFFSPLRTSWPCQMQITNSFFWANTYNGNSCNPDVYSGSTATIQQGRDYWLQAPSAANGLPTGAFASYRPLAYPHPLVSGIAQGPATNALISVSPGMLNYGSQASGTSSNQTFTVQNIGGGTLSGTASVSAPFSIVSGASYNLGSNQAQSVTVRFSPANSGTYQQVVTLTGGGGASVTVGGSAWSVLPGLSFASTAGTITDPFVTNADQTISQAVETADPTTGGRAAYAFAITTAGAYEVTANVNAPDQSSNSLFVNIDAEPTSPDMVWDMALTSGFVNQTVTWRQSGGVLPQVWTLTAGVHELIIRGREAGVVVGQIAVVPSGQNRPGAPSAPSNLRITANGG
jgi:hypothetical protein